MTGTVIRVLGGAASPPKFYGCVILADGEYFNTYDPRWINAPAPRNGQYIFEGFARVSVGQRVTFDAQPGTILPGGTFETASTAVNVQPA